MFFTKGDWSSFATRVGRSYLQLKKIKNKKYLQLEKTTI